MTHPARRSALCLLPRLVLLAALATPASGADDPSKPPTPPLTAAQRERLKERDRLAKETRQLQAAGKLDQAIKAAEAMLKIERDVLGPDSDDALGSLDLLSQLHLAREDWAAARSARREALDRLTARLGKDHWRVADARLALSDVQLLTGLTAGQRGRLGEARRLNAQGMHGYRKGQYREATVPARQALAIRREVLGERHPDTITSLNDLAGLLKAQGDLKAARPLLERALELRRAVLGERHPDTITSLNNLAHLLNEQGDLKAARLLAGRGLEAAERLASETLPALTEREQLAYLGSVRGTLDLNLTLTAGGAGGGDAYRHVLAWKGLAAQAAAARAAAQLPGARDLLAELVPLRVRLNAMHFARVPADRTTEHARATRALADQITGKESELARAVGWRPEAPDSAAVAAALPPEAALVDLLRYWHTSRSDRERSGLQSEYRYVAFVVRKGERPERVELGPAAPIEEALAAWRARLQGGDDAEEMSRKLAGMVWTPLVKHLGGARIVLVSPDWQLSFLPWAALPDQEPGSFLIRRYAFGTLVSARQLTELAKPRTPPAGGGLLAVGGVDYGKADAAPAGVTVASRSAAMDRGSLAFGPLPGTVAEAREVAELYERSGLGRVEGPSGSAATKERLRAAMAGRRHLHLATHRFFAPPEVKSALAPEDDPTGLKSWEGMSRGEVRGFYPGLLSGLIWAGAAAPPRDRLTGAEDLGSCLMTAEEVESLELNGCELAVLSACETGLGATAGGEGVKGLQSAFHSAGCRTVVASLWRVDDAATRALMTRFYTNLWENKQPALAALREAQLSILDDPDFGDKGNPRLWAAWVLSGDPGGPAAELAEKVGGR
jgi:CHAT domain-containing protein